MSLALNNNSSQSQECDKKLLLDLWLMKRGIKKKDVAEEMGLTPQNFSRILNGNYTDESVYSSLTELEFQGERIPEEYIPQPRKKLKPGPKRRV